MTCGRFAPFSHAGRPHPLAKTASFPRCYGPEFVAKELREWLAKVGTGTLYIEPGSPWENGYCESFNGKLRDECFERRNFLLVEGGTDNDREMAGGIQHEAPALGTRLQAACPGGL